MMHNRCTTRILSQHKFWLLIHPLVICTIKLTEWTIFWTKCNEKKLLLHFTPVIHQFVQYSLIQFKIRKDIARTDVFCFHNYKTELKVRPYSSTLKTLCRVCIVYRGRHINAIYTSVKNSYYSYIYARKVKVSLYKKELRGQGIFQMNVRGEALVSYLSWNGPFLVCQRTGTKTRHQFCDEFGVFS